MIKSITPEKAVDLYLDECGKQYAKSTCRHRLYHLKRFLEWCGENDVDDLSTVSGHELYEFKVKRRDIDKINTVTQKKQLETLRLFLRFCEQLEYVPDNTSERVMVPRLTSAEDVRDTVLDEKTGSAILAYLMRFEYASPYHVVFYLFLHTGMRTGSLVSLDVEDYHSDEQYIELRHQPKTGTPLKNKQAGEREINLNDKVCDIIDDYLCVSRRDVKDEFGRNPLLTTWNGRVKSRLLQKWLYVMTRPCYYSGTCPYEREIEECEASTFDTASKCPDSISPHPMRRSAITTQLKAGIPKAVVSERANVSIRVLDEYYDFRTEADKRENRREYIDMM